MNINLVDTEASVSGTSLQGYIKTTYADLVEVFGEPRYSGGDDKVTTEWNLEFRVATIFEDIDDEYEYVTATIYDWKLCGTPFVEYDWHIGGHTTQAAHVVAEYMKRSKWVSEGYEKLWSAKA